MPKPLDRPVQSAEERARRDRSVGARQRAASDACGDQRANRALVPVAPGDDGRAQARRQSVDVEVRGGSLDLIDQAQHVSPREIAKPLGDRAPTACGVPARGQQPIEGPRLTKIKDFVLPGEVVVEVARREICRDGNLAHAGGGEPLRAEDPGRRLEDLEAPAVGTAPRPPEWPRTTVRKVNHGSIVDAFGVDVKRSRRRTPPSTWLGMP